MKGYSKYIEMLEDMFEDDPPAYICGAGKSFLKVRVSDNFSDPKTGDILTVRVPDVIFYYAHDARNITSGIRSLAGHYGDWRPIDNLANLCLQYFKRANRPALEKEGKKYGMTLR